MTHLEILLLLAEGVARRAHEGQMDLQDIEYIHHPETVSGYCETIEGKIVGWLHDVVEDTSVTLDDLRNIGFDDYLLEALRCVTKEPGYDEVEYYARIKANPIAKEVKLADLRHNSDPTRIREGLPEEIKTKILSKREKYNNRKDYLNGNVPEIRII